VARWRGCWRGAVLMGYRRARPLVVAGPDRAPPRPFQRHDPSRHVDQAGLYLCHRRFRPVAGGAGPAGPGAEMNPPRNGFGPLPLLAIVLPGRALQMSAPGRRPCRGLVMGRSSRGLRRALVTLTALPTLAANLLGPAAAGPHPADPGRGRGPGLFAGAAGAFVYCFHCTEEAAPFIAIWYTLGIAVVNGPRGAFGAAPCCAGKRLFTIQGANSASEIRLETPPHAQIHHTQVPHFGRACLGALLALVFSISLGHAAPPLP